MAIVLLPADDFGIIRLKPSGSLKASAVKCSELEFSKSFSCLELNVCITFFLSFGGKTTVLSHGCRTHQIFQAGAVACGGIDECQLRGSARCKAAVV